MIDALSREIDEAVIAAPGEQALITVNQGTRLQNRLSGIEKNPAVKKRQSLTRAHAGFGRLRALQIELLTQKEPVLPQLLGAQKGIDLKALTDDERVVAIENSWMRIQTDFDARVDALDPNDPQYDVKVNKIFQELTRPIIDEVVLGRFERLTRRKKGIGGFLGAGLIQLVRDTEEEALIEKRINTLKDKPVFERFTPAEQQQAIDFIEAGSTIEDAVVEVETGVDIPTVTTKAERDKLSKGTRYRGPDGSIAVKQ